MVALQILAVALAWLALDRLLHSLFVSTSGQYALPFRFSRGLERGLRVTLFVVAFLGACQVVGIAPSRVWTTLSAFIALVAVGFFAFWSVASNILCAFIILLVRPFKIGDRIELFDPKAEKLGVTGEVVDVGAFFTVLREGDEASGVRLLVPNNLVLQQGIRLIRASAEKPTAGS